MVRRSTGKHWPREELLFRYHAPAEPLTYNSLQDSPIDNEPSRTIPTCSQSHPPSDPKLPISFLSQKKKNAMSAIIRQLLIVIIPHACLPVHPFLDERLDSPAPAFHPRSRIPYLETAAHWASTIVHIVQRDTEHMIGSGSASPKGRTRCVRRDDVQQARVPNDRP